MFPCPLVLITWEFMGAKHDKVKKIWGKGQIEAKKICSKRYNMSLSVHVICPKSV
jgi:hypothetical protein